MNLKKDANRMEYIVHIRVEVQTQEQVTGSSLHTHTEEVTVSHCV